jgi:hypothetical protein
LIALKIFWEFNVFILLVECRWRNDTSRSPCYFTDSDLPAYPLVSSHVTSRFDGIKNRRSNGFALRRLGT